MSRKLARPFGYTASRVALAYTLYVPLWAGSLALSASLISAALASHRAVLAIACLPSAAALAAALYTALSTLRAARRSTSFERFSEHVFFSALALVSSTIVILICYMAFQPILMHLPGV